MDKLIKFSTIIIAIGPTEFIIEKGNIIKVIELLLLLLMEAMLSYFFNYKHIIIIIIIGKCW